MLRQWNAHSDGAHDLVICAGFRPIAYGSRLTNGYGTRLPATMQTVTGRRLVQECVQRMRAFCEQLLAEIQ